MSTTAVLFKKLTFGYEEAATVLFTGLTFHFPAGWTGIVGANGAGKTTILKLVTGELRPDEGQVQAPDKAVYCPQRTDEPPAGLEALLAAAEGEAPGAQRTAGDRGGLAGARGDAQSRRTQAREILERVRQSPREILGRTMTAVSCLGSRPERLLESAEPSPGELRKLLLAMGMAQAPHLVVMDEPTNHLDLPSIECLEEALQDCPCGLLLVSHDRRFLQRLTLHALAGARRSGPRRERCHGAGSGRREVPAAPTRSSREAW